MSTKSDFQDDGQNKKHKKDDAPSGKSGKKKTMVGRAILFFMANYKPANGKENKPDA